MMATYRLAAFGFAAWLGAGALFAQQAAQQAATPQAAQSPYDGAQAGEAIGRCVQLMESTATVLPALKSSSVSLIADARATLADLQRTPGNASFTYHFLNDIEAYLQLGDVLPRPGDIPQ